MMKILTILISLIASGLAAMYPSLDAEETRGVLELGLAGALSLIAGAKIIAGLLYTARSTQPQKPLWQSRAWWLGLGAVIVSIARLFAIELDEGHVTTAITHLYDAALSLFISGGGLTVMWRRWVLKKEAVSRKPLVLPEDS